MKKGGSRGGSAFDIDEFAQDLESSGLVAERGENYKLSSFIRLDRHFVSEAWSAFLDELYEQIRSLKGGSLTQPRKRALEAVMTSLASKNLATGHKTWIRYSRRHAGKTELQGPLKYIAEGMALLELVDHLPGKPHLGSGTGYKSAFRDTAQLREMILSAGLDPWLVRRSVPDGPIQRKNNKGKLLAVQRSALMTRMRRNVETINAMLDAAQVRYDPGSSGMPFPLRSKEQGTPEKGKPRSEKVSGFDKEPYDISNRTLYRVFNRSSYDFGGRFFGHWAQQIPRQYRKHITMNGQPTVEVDYSAMHISMLYALAKKPMPEEDAYEVAGHGRGLCKAVLNAVINAKTRNAAIQAVVNDARKEGGKVAHGDVKDILSQLEARHEPIRDFFGSDYGVKLMRIESDIAESVMLGLHAKGIPSLPVHDSFLAPVHAKEALIEAMKAAYQERLGVAPGVDVKVEETESTELSGPLVELPEDKIW